MNKKDNYDNFYKAMVIITCGNKILLINKLNKEGEAKWTFPTSECRYRFMLLMKFICRRDILRKTGLKIRIKKLIFNSNKLYTFIGDIKRGELLLEKKREKDIIGVKWVKSNDLKLYNFTNIELINSIINNTKVNELPLNLSAYYYRK